MADYAKKVLQMIFENSLGKQTTISIPYPKDTITALELETLMNTMITKNIISNDGAELSSIKDGGIVEKSFTDLVE
ncbi:MAG TPA: DUF2922 domain-containing protein [Caldisericia bacterium]|jgi:hypothetical protein|nr:DUF2922 domain-containing protein [Caldisericia bacterium]HXK51496.1 DUF2922 domain-containing protein [Caldisericia bacterium]